MYSKEIILDNFIEKQINSTPELTRQFTNQNNHKLRHRQEFQKLKEYVETFLKEETINRYIVLPGIRGVGKTTLLYQTYEYLFKELDISHNDILYVSCEELNYLTDSNLINVVEAYLNNFHDTSIAGLNKKIFLLVDEAQYDKNWAIAGKILYDRTKKYFHDIHRFFST